MSDRKLDNQLIDFFASSRLSPVRLEEMLRETAEVKRTTPVETDTVDDSRLTRTLRSRLTALVFRIAPPQPFTLAIPLVITVAIATGLILQLFDNNPDHAATVSAEAPLELSSLVLKEAALNHRSKFKLDVVASDVEGIQQGMQRLDFNVELPEPLISGYELVGGRYCTLGGRLAAHIRLKVNDLPVLSDEKDKSKTLAVSRVQFNDMHDNPVTLEQSSAQSRSRSLFMTRTDSRFDAGSDLTLQLPDNLSVKSWQQGDLLFVLAEGRVQDVHIQ